MIELHEDFSFDVEEIVCNQIVDLVKKGEKSITISIDSNGGYVSVLECILKTIDWARSHGVEVNTYNKKKAYSCGAMLLSYGDTRTMHPTARSMIHDVGVSELGGGKVGDLEEKVKHLREFNNIWMGWLAKNMKMSPKRLSKIVAGADLYLTAEESKRLKLVDKIDILT